MELDEALARLLRRHLLLIAATIVLAVGAALAMHRSDVPRYAASARLLLSHQTVSSDAEATAIIGRASALATSRAVVAAAIQDTKVRRDPAVVVRDEVVLNRVGESPVGQLTVTDPDPLVAAKLANEIGRRVVSFLGSTDGGDARAAIAGVDQRLAALQAQRNDVAASLARTTDPLRASTLQGTQQALDRQIGDLSAQRSQILADDALRPRPDVVDSAVAPTKPLPSKKLQDTALGALLGVLLGLGLAGLAEVVRPTVAGSRAVSRRLNAPLLGSLTSGLSERRHRDDREFADIVLKLRFVAARSGARTVLLLGDQPEAELAGFAARVDEQLARAPLPAPASAPLMLPATAVEDAAVDNALTLATPATWKQGTLAASGQSGQLLLPPARTLRSTPRGLLLVGPHAPNGETALAQHAPDASSGTGLASGRVLSRGHQRLRVHTLRTLTDEQLDSDAVVVVAVCATVLPQRRLDDVADSLAAVGGPLAGVLTYRQRRLRRLSRPYRATRKDQRP